MSSRSSSTAAAAPDRRRPTAATRALAALFVLSLPAVTPRIYASDEVQWFSFLRSIWFDRDVSFENEYRHFYERGVAATDGFHETFLERTTETGRRINFGTLGPALLWAPFYAVADLSVRIQGAAGSPGAADGFGGPYLAAVAVGSALYGFLALLLAVAFTRRVLGGGGELPAMAIWAGTPLLFYMYLSPAMAHACSAFAVALFLVAWIRVRERWSLGGLALLGALAAIMAMVREQDVFFVAGPALDYARTLARAARPGWSGPPVAALAGRAAAGAAVACLVFVPQALAYVALNGRIGPSPLVGRKMNWTAPHALDVLVSADHGFFFWTPVAALALAGLAWLAIRDRAPADAPVARHPEARWIATSALLMAALQVYVGGSVESWTLAGAFGQRRLVSLTALLVLGLTALVQASATAARRAALGALVALAVWWNLGLMAQFGAGLMDRQRLELARNAYNTFVVVPRALPGLAYRYLFDRSSFYRQPSAQAPTGSVQYRGTANPEPRPGN